MSICGTLREMYRGVPCGRGPVHVSTEDRYRTWLRDLFEQKSECVFGGEPVALLVAKG